MLTLLTMIAGFASSLAPDLLKRWQDSSDKKHELAVLDIQLKQADNAHIYRMDEVNTSAYADIVTSAHRSQDAMLDKASKWVVNLTATVRPVVTYVFLMSFIGFKFCAFIAAVNTNLPWQDSLTYSQAMLSVWGEEETALFAGLLAFWFGDRSMTKGKR